MGCNTDCSVDCRTVGCATHFQFTDKSGLMKRSIITDINTFLLAVYSALRESGKQVIVPPADTQILANTWNGIHVAMPSSLSTGSTTYIPPGGSVVGPGNRASDALKTMNDNYCTNVCWCQDNCGCDCGCEYTCSPTCGCDCGCHDQSDD